MGGVLGMLPTVETDVVEIVGPRQVRFERETLVLEGMGPREVGAETIYSAVSPGTKSAMAREEMPQTEMVDSRLSPLSAKMLPSKRSI